MFKSKKEIDIPNEEDRADNMRNYYSKWLKAKKVMMGLGVGIVIVVAIHGVYSNRINYVDTDDVTEINCRLVDGQFTIQPLTIRTQFKKSDTNLKMDFTNIDIATFDNYDNTTSMTYSDKDTPETMYELALSDVPIEKDLTEGLSVEKSTIASSKKGLSDGFMYLLGANYKKSRNEFDKYANSLTKNITFSKPSEEENTILNIEGIGTLNLKDLSIFSESNGVYYGVDKILRLYNPKDDIPYIFLTHVNNSLLLNSVSNLQTTEYNNVYVDKDYGNIDKMGYKSMSIMTSSGLYTFKLNEKSPDGLEDELIDKLNVHKDDEKIELPYQLNVD